MVTENGAKNIEFDQSLDFSEWDWIKQMIANDGKSLFYFYNDVKYLSLSYCQLSCSQHKELKARVGYE